MSASDVLVSPVTIWRSNVGVARPYESVGYGAAWDGWTQLGYTSEPLTITFEREKLDIMVQQSLSKIGSRITAETLTIETALAEFTMPNLALSWPGTVTIQPAEVGVIPYEKLKGGGKICLSTLQWGFEGLYMPEDCSAKYPLRFFCIGEAEMGGEIAFNKEEQTGIPLSINVSWDSATSTLYEWFKVTGVAL